MRIKSADDLPPHLRDQVQAAAASPKPSRQKFGNQIVEEGGRRFGSKWELKRFNELRQQGDAGLITELAHHVEFPLHVRTPAGAAVRVGCYEADMTYRREGRLVIEDTKSAATRRHPLFRWKAAHFEAEYGVQVLEVTRVRRTRHNREVRV